MTKRNAFLAARLKAGYRYQQDAASAAGLAQSVVSDLESGKHINPTWDVLGRLCQLYSCRPEELLPWPKLPRNSGRGK